MASRHGHVRAPLDAAHLHANTTAQAVEGNLGGLCVCNSGIEVAAILLGLRQALWLGLRVADGFGEHLTQLSLRLRRLARCFLSLGHEQYVGCRRGN